MSKNKGGRPSHEPTDATRKQVETMAGYGVPEPGIAKSIGIGEVTLRKYYRDELDIGVVKANSAVAQSLYKKALGQGSGSVAAGIFWLKTRARWKETSVHEHSGPNGTPIQTFDLSKLKDLTDEELDAAERIHAKLAALGGNPGGEEAAGD
jgi:hypothetical protein